MTARTTAIAFVAALALAPPSGAAAQESLVPPENSAAAQYTEAIPTAGGEKSTRQGGKATPVKALGAGNAKQLASQGEAGREAARLAAETAPQPVAGGGDAGAQPGEAGSQNGGGGSTGQAQRSGDAGEATQARANSPAGSSGLDAVIGEATGSSSSGGLGVLLPLAVVATLLWALAYLWRHRRSAAERT